MSVSTPCPAVSGGHGVKYSFSWKAYTKFSLWNAGVYIHAMSYMHVSDVCEDQVLVVVKESLAIAGQQPQQVPSTTASGQTWLCMELQAGAVDSPSTASNKNS